MDQFTTFQQFNVREEALELANLLEEHGIAYRLETGAEEFNPAFVFNGQCRILVRQEDVARITALFTADVAPDYYLYDFTDQELFQVIDRRDEWSHLDFTLAQEILKSRGIEVREEHVLKTEEKRIALLGQPDNISPTWIAVGYILAFGGGFLGLLLGGSILSGKKVLPNGVKVYNYSESDRKHARRILAISAITLTIALVFRVLKEIRIQRELLQ